jgi:hypothetical protein
MFGDEHWAMLAGGRAVAQVGREEIDVDGLPASNDVIYLALSLRNAGSGLAVLHGWRFAPERLRPGSGPARRTRRRSSGRRPGTCTSRPATSGSGRARCATPPTRSTSRRRRPSRPASR